MVIMVVGSGSDDDDGDDDDTVLFRLFATSQDHQLHPSGSHSIPRWAFWDRRDPDQKIFPLWPTDRCWGWSRVQTWWLLNLIWISPLEQLYSGSKHDNFILIQFSNSSSNIWHLERERNWCSRIFVTSREWEKLFLKITTWRTRPFSCPLVTYPAITISISHCHCHTTTIHCLINAQCYIKSVIMVGLYFLARLRKTTSCKICNMHFKL